jgi:hypothetical protein
MIHLLCEKPSHLMEAFRHWELPLLYLPKFTNAVQTTSTLLVMFLLAMNTI